MSLLNYSEIANPASSKDVLNRIRIFALAQGWTVDDYQTDSNWVWTGSKYEWQAASSPNDYDFLQIYTNGYGSQEIIIRFLAYSLTHPTAGQLAVTGTEPGYRTPDDQVSTIPFSQHPKYGSSRNNRLPLAPSTMPKMWVFGNDKWLCVVVQTQTNVVMGMQLGSIEMFDPTRDDGFYIVECSYWDYNLRPYDEAHLYPGNHITPFDYINQGTSGWHMIWNEDTNNNQWHVNLYLDGGISGGGYWNRIWLAVQANAFTGKRTLMKPTVFYRRVSDLVWEPVGTFPVYRLVFAGLNIGDQISYGAEDYLVFPCTFPTRKFGFCFRIA